MRIRIADFVIDVKNKYEYVEAFCRNYLTDDENVDFSVECTAEEIAYEGTKAEEGFSSDALECLAVYRKICTEIVDRGAFLMHSAVIEVDGDAYAFLAKSGTGKSTHIVLWRKTIGESVKIINGDKPIYRYIDGDLFVYGTPWCGKEGWNRNARARLKAICYIERAEQNSIEKITPAQSVLRAMKQVFIPYESEKASKTLDLVDKMLIDKQSWLLKCNISSEAAELAYNTMKE